MQDAGARLHLQTLIFNTNHESPKGRNHERKSNCYAQRRLPNNELYFFELSFFRSFVPFVIVYLFSLQVLSCTRRTRLGWI